MKPCRK